MVFKATRLEKHDGQLDVVPAGETDFLKVVHKSFERLVTAGQRDDEVHSFGG